MHSGSRTSWQPDGWEASVRIGLLVPHADVGPEAEIGAMAPREVSVHAARAPFGAMAAGGQMDPTIPLAPVREFAEQTALDDAAGLLADSPLSAIGYAFTSSAYVIGAKGEAAMIARLAARTGGIPVVATCAAIVEGLRELRADRLALIDPPWFDAELSALGRAYYDAAGFEVVDGGPCELPSDQGSVTPEALHAWAAEHVPADAEAVVIGGNGFRAVGAIDALERDLGKPVVSANQALFWAALVAAGADPGVVRGYGALFALGRGR